MQCNVVLLDVCNVMELELELELECNVYTYGGFLK